MNKLNIPQLATLRINCNGDVGTALIYFLAEDSEYVYILTARHCLEGEDFDKKFQQEDILLDRIYNSLTGEYSSYRLTTTDTVICSPSKIIDIAILILPSKNILPLVGSAFNYKLVGTVNSKECLMRGFSNFSEGEEDLPFKAEFTEDIKDNPALFMVKSPENLDAYYHHALHNVRGLSGSGLFVKIGDTFYLSGITHTYQEKSFFISTRISSFNTLLPVGYLRLNLVTPEENQTTIESFNKLTQNTKTIKLRARNTVAMVNVERDLGPVRKMLSNNQAVIIHGKAGVGKSAMARALVEELENSGFYTIAAFTAEQFLEDSLSQTMSVSGLSIDFDEILNSPLSGKKVLIWIESFEKLIDAGRQGAFAELLEKLISTNRLKLIVTIREYRLQKFKILYHYELPSSDIFYSVEEFTKPELDFILKQIPALTPLFINSKLNNLLINPYYLDKAVRILPHLLKEEDLDEEGFKRLMWEHIIENGDKQRGITFSTIALKRAKEMTLFSS